jgi:hypothetical protein
MDLLLLNPNIIGGIVTLIVTAFIIKYLFFRPKLPPNKTFECARCKVLATHSERTIEAWRKGIKKLYCANYHKQWLQSQPRQQHQVHTGNSSGGGCLSVIVLAIFIPSVFIGLLNWLA